MPLPFAPLIRAPKYPLVNAHELVSESASGSVRSLDKEKAFVNRLQPHVLLIGCILAAAAYHYSNLQPIHGWSDDGSVYLQHADNILNNRPYNHVLFGQAVSISSPPALYPPALPVLLGPVLLWRGLDFTSIKIMMLLFMVMASIASAYALGSIVGDSIASLTAICLVGTFVLWRQADHLNSDFLFLFTISLYFIVSDNWRNRGNALAPKVVVCSALIVIATMIRTIGFVLIPSLAFYTIWRHRRMTTEASLVCGVSAVSLMILHRWYSAGTYVGQFENLVSWSTVRRNLIQYPLATAELVGGGLFAAAVIDCLIAVGVFLLVRRRPHLWATFAACYVPVLMLWPYSDPIRFLIPLWPWLFTCALIAVAWLMSRFTIAKWVLSSVAAIHLAAQIPLYTSHPRAAGHHGLNDAEAMQVYRFSRRTLHADAVIACRKPRTFALMTRRRSIQYGLLGPEAMAEDLCRSGATHVVTAPAIFRDDAAYLDPFASHYREKLDLVFQNTSFSMYQIGRLTLECRSKRNARPPEQERGRDVGRFSPVHSSAGRDIESGKSVLD